jgi:peptide methionine sulfoxide reductase msrA/msrB
MTTTKDISLTDEQIKIVRQKATELPYSGEYNLTSQPGTYLCRRCGQALFRSDSKFNTACGWPSFDEAIDKAVTSSLDEDGRRQEILCAHCQAHLGHIFEGEKLTPQNKRYCVNLVSLDFVENKAIIDTEEAIVAGGCFWGVEGNSGHFEALRILYDPSLLSYQSLLKYFFEIHDPTQENGQGHDLGQQYQSAVFYYNEEQRKEAEALIADLKKRGYSVATQLFPISTFWKAESYHQHYYDKTGKNPYCHVYTKRF